MNIKKYLSICLLVITISFSWAQQNSGHYTLVVEGFDWGAAVSKVILHLPENVTQVNARDYQVSVKRISDCMNADSPNQSGTRDIITAYVSDKQGQRMAEGMYLTFLLEVGPHISVGSPLQYFATPECRGNKWVDYQISVSRTSDGMNWNQEANRIIPLVDDFNLGGSYTHNEEISLRYAHFKPETDKASVPLIIWLHGGGEGGTDPSVVLLANRAANYAAPEIQKFFGGAYVLAPQSPTFWMQSASGDYTRGDVEDIYNESLMGLIRQFIAEHPDIDTSRIYVGGCSNGGYMTQKLLLKEPDFFAAAFPSALAFNAEHLSEADIQTLAGQSIWYIHSADDTVTPPDTTVLPTVERLMAAGAKDVHLSYYDHVVDLYGTLGGDDFHLFGHFSWVYSHRNHAKKEIDGKEITVMEWLASKSR